jgi:S1-C subfamily serine protease
MIARIVLLIVVTFIVPQSGNAEDNNIYVNPAAKSQDIAKESVVRIICYLSNRLGTGFFHKSGKFITAAHVVEGCPTPIVILTNGKKVLASVQTIDNALDLALVVPLEPVAIASFEVSKVEAVPIGTQVITWGYPAGYTGVAPLLSAGYLAGVDTLVSVTQERVTKWVVNGAFNSGNSGGPLLQADTGQVIGVVSSKLAPISQASQSALQALQNQGSGLVYPGVGPKGLIVDITEAQVVAQILNELRSQVQLVIGYAVFTKDLKKFLLSHDIEP